MKVLLVNTYDSGGAAKACIRLHLSLLDQGVDSHLLFLTSSKNIPHSSSFLKDCARSKRKRNMMNVFNVIRYTFSWSIFRQKRFLRERPSNLEVFTYPNSEFDITQCKVYKNADLINLHWVAQLLDYSTFFDKNKKPVVWTLHDMSPFLGGEHYKETLVGMNSNGEAEPRNMTSIEKKEYLKIERIKEKIFSKVDYLTFVTLNEWMSEELNNQEVIRTYDHRIIANGISSKQFFPEQIDISRKSLSLPSDAKILLFIADSISNKRKGIEFLLKALDWIDIPDLLVVTVGDDQDFKHKSNKFYHYGFVNDDNVMRKLYNSADIFVIPSLLDNQPNTVLESLFCGTAVIGFKTGGIGELIDDGINGYLIDDINAKNLAEGINTFFTKGVAQCKLEIAKNTSEKYSSEKQAENYKKLFLHKTR